MAALKYNVGFLNSLSCAMAVPLLMAFCQMLHFECLPLIIKPFVTGLFIPIYVLILFNSNVLYGIVDQQTHWWLYIPLLIYILAAWRTGGFLGDSSSKQMTKEVIKARPYLGAPNLLCDKC